MVGQRHLGQEIDHLPQMVIQLDLVKKLSKNPSRNEDSAELNRQYGISHEEEVRVVEGAAVANGVCHE